MSGTVSTTAAASSTTSSAASRTSLGSDFSTFLTLLTTQIQNQDPTDPLDTNAMTNQLVQFASVEQQIAMNQNLGSLISLQQSAQLTAAAPLIGRQVEVESNQLPLQNGTATVRLPAAGNARTAVVTVSSSSGTVLRQQVVSLGSAAQDWQWDGRDTAGRTVADGTYNVAVAGYDSNGSTASVGFGVVGTVTGAERSGTNLNLSLGGVAVSFDKLRRVVPTS